MTDTPARELAQHLSDLVTRVQNNISMMQGNAQFDSSNATMYKQLHDLFMHYDEEKLEVALKSLKPPVVEIMRSTEFSDRDFH